MREIKTLSNGAVEQLRIKYIQWCQVNKFDSDLFDFNSELDMSLTYWEAWNNIEDKLSVLKDNGNLQKKQITAIKDRELQENKTPAFKIDLDLTDSVAIVGDRNSGKTNLAFSLMNNYKGKRKKYLYGYPKQIKGYLTISTWTDILKISDGVIFIDEIQRYIKLYDRKANIELMELLSFLAHQRNTLIFNTQLSQFITKGVEATIQTWLVKQLDVQSLKNGCKIKRILKETANPKITDKGMALVINEYIAWDNNMPLGFSGIHTFEDQNVGKDWKNPNGTATETPKDLNSNSSKDKVGDKNVTINETF